jgi:ubiquitin C-terminal hydrolase
MLISSVKCRKCKFVSKAFDPFLDLSLEIKRRDSSIKDCMKSFFSKEKLDDKYLCEKCNKKTYATKKI